MDQSSSTAPIFAKLVDGSTWTEYSITPSLSKTLSEKARFLATLSITIDVGPQSQLFTSIFAAGFKFPSLQELRVTVVHPITHETFCLVVPTLDLPTERFPSLKGLRLDGVAVNMSSPFLPSLRWLVLRNYPAMERRLPVTQFMAALSYCPNLESLQVRHYGGAFSVTGNPPQRPVSLPSLKDLLISDTPAVSSLLLQVFYIPPTANITVFSDVKGFYEDDFGRGYVTMLPSDRRTMPILRDIESLEVSLNATTYHVVGETPLGRRLTLDIDMGLEFSLGFTAGDVLYESTVRNLAGVFRESPIREAVFRGDFTRFSPNSWRVALGALPKLARIRVDDVGAYGEGAKALFEALALPAALGTGSPTRMLCPQLEVLMVQGDKYGLPVLDEVAKCLECREKAGTKLRRLYVGLSVGLVSGKKVELEKYERRLERLVPQCRISV
ncbi:hypothetical protein C8Q77DRAFT_1091659 [Trametes polyzona]|nr:hypothetical protein C8Q77DRAFT_1091659 [Trametes polyzona]